MKRILTVAVSVLFISGLAYGGASYWIGSQARRFHDQSIARINGSRDLKASVVSYKRGLFSSRAITRLTLKPPRKGRPISFEVVDTIYNGPFVFLHDPHLRDDLRPVMAVVRTRLAPGPNLGAVLEKIPELGSAEVLTVLSLGGNASSYLDIPSFQHSFPDRKGGQIAVKWGGLAGKLHFDSQLSKADCSLDCPSLLVSGQDGRLQIENVRGRFDSHPGIQGITVGSTSVSIGDITSVKDGHSVFTLNSADLRAQSRVDGNKINGSIRLDFDKLDTGGLGLGPFAIDIEARRLDAGVLARFQKLAPVLQREEIQTDKAAKYQARILLLKIAADLLAGRPELEIKQLDLRTDKGDLTGKARLGFDGADKGFSRNILMLLASIDANAQLSVSQALFYFIAQNALDKNGASGSDQAKTDAAQLAARFLAAKYMISEAGAFKSSAAFKHGVLTVNGSRLGLSKLP